MVCKLRVVHLPLTRDYAGLDSDEELAPRIRFAIDIGLRRFRREQRADLHSIAELRGVDQGPYDDRNIVGVRRYDALREGAPVANADVPAATKDTDEKLAQAAILMSMP